MYATAATMPFTTIDSATLDAVTGGVDWAHVANTAKTTSEHVGAAGTAVGAVAGGVIGAGGGAVAVPGLGAVPGWLAGAAAGGGIGYALGTAGGYIGGAAKGIWDTWGK